MISTKQIKSKPSFSTTKRIISASFVKPLVASAVILTIDRFYFKNSDLTSNLYFAGSVGLGTFASSSIAEATRGMIPTNTMIGSLGKNRNIFIKIDILYIRRTISDTISEIISPVAIAISFI